MAEEENSDFNAYQNLSREDRRELEQTLDGLIALIIDNTATLNTLITLQVRMLAQVEDLSFDELLEEVNDIKQLHHQEIVEWLRSGPLDPADDDSGDNC